METLHKFDKDYYEHGVTKRISGYEDYHYIPTRSYEEAAEISPYTWGSILDFGCAKGFLVHALRQLGSEAYGYDISEYAINNCHPRVKEFVSNELPNKTFDLVVCKDVMEHVLEDEVLSVLKTIHSLCNNAALFVIPLGDNDKFRIREYEIDITHVTKKDEDWWIDKFREAGFEMYKFSYSFGRIKEKWKHYPHGNGFFWVSK